jgi:hypothetical protein
LTLKVDALSVSCPQCGVPAGDRCWSGTRRGRRLQRGSHRGRERRAAGEAVADDVGVWPRREIARVEAEVVSRRKP